jgi:hypothetical protein
VGYHEVFLECVFPQLLLLFLACSFSALALRAKLFCDISAIIVCWVISCSQIHISFTFVIYHNALLLYYVVQEVAHISDKILCNLNCLVWFRLKLSPHCYLLHLSRLLINVFCTYCFLSILGILCRAQ